MDIFFDDIVDQFRILYLSKKNTYPTNLIIQSYVCVFAVFCISACGSGGGRTNGENIPPTANAGFDQFVTLSSAPVPLDASESQDANGDTLNYQWEILSKPIGSSAILTSATSPAPMLTALDFLGEYEVALSVNDGTADSDIDVVIITALPNAKNIVLLIGDGMGFEQVRAAGMYANGVAGSLSFEKFPYQGFVNTLNAENAITDSGAAATAMATGIKVSNTVISMAIPGNGIELMTIFEVAKSLGASIGLVTTTTISHATPAAFGAHETSRNNYPEIILDYLTGSQPNVLFGGGEFIDPDTSRNAGYTVVEDDDSLNSINTDFENMVWGQFGETHMPYELDGLGIYPHLSDLARTALDIVDNDPDGFILVIEGGRIDHAGHSNDIQRSVLETIEFSNTAKVVMDWARNRNDTLVIVTADHETGGLQILDNNGKSQFPSVTWSTTGHTDFDVPIYAWGVNAHMVNGHIDNTDIYTLMDTVLLGN